MISQKIRYSTVIDTIIQNPEWSVCEVGSGSQGVGRYLPNLKFTGLDHDFSDYSNTEKTPGGNMTAVKADARKLPFNDNHFDFVFCLDVLEHVSPKDRPKVIKEIIRITKRKVIIAFPCGPTAEKIDRREEQWLKRLRMKIPGWLKEHLEIPYPQFSETQQAIERTGYTAYTFGCENSLVRQTVQFAQIVTLGFSKLDGLCTFPFLIRVTRKGKKHYRTAFVIEKST